MSGCISDLLLQVDKQPHPFCFLFYLSLSLSTKGGVMPQPAHTRRSKRDLLPYQLEQTAARQRKVRQNEGGMKDGNMDDTQGCNGQGHITMEILQQDDIEGDC